MRESEKGEGVKEKTDEEIIGAVKDAQRRLMMYSQRLCKMVDLREMYAEKERLLVAIDDVIASRVELPLVSRRALIDAHPVVVVVRRQEATEEEAKP